MTEQFGKKSMIKKTNTVKRPNTDESTLQDSFRAVIKEEKSNRKAFQKVSMARLGYVISLAYQLSKKQYSSFREKIQKFLNEKGIKTSFSENTEDNFPYYMELVFFYVMIKAGYKIDKDFASEKSKVLRACRQLLEMGLTKKTRKGIRLFCEKNHITSVRKLADQYSQEHPSKQKNDGHAHQDDVNTGKVDNSNISEQVDDGQKKRQNIKPPTKKGFKRLLKRKNALYKSVIILKGSEGNGYVAIVNKSIHEKICELMEETHVKQIQLFDEG